MYKIEIYKKINYLTLKVMKASYTRDFELKFMSKKLEKMPFLINRIIKKNFTVIFTKWDRKWVIQGSSNLEGSNRRGLLF